MTAVEKRADWRMPDAEPVLPISAPRPEWLERRRRGLGGSDASTVVGVNRWSSRYELWLDKTGRLRDKDTSPRMEAGTRLEPVLRQWFTDEKGIEVRQVGLVASRVRPWQMVSLDGLTADGGIFESKCTSWRLADEWDDGQIADHAEVQAQHGLAVTGRSHAWVVVLIDGWDFQIRRVERDEKLIAAITQMEHDFWHDHVLADREPAIEPNALDAIKQRYADIDPDAIAAASPADWAPLLREYREAAHAAKQAAARKDAADAAIRALIGPAEALTVLGERVATCKQITTRRLDSKALRAEHPDLAERYTTESSYRKLAISKEA